MKDVKEIQEHFNKIHSLILREIADQPSYISQQNKNDLCYLIVAYNKLIRNFGFQPKHETDLISEEV